MINQFSIELGLTEQQKQQIVPFLKQELPQLAELEKNTSISALQKVEQLKQISGAVDAKITPLLDPEQQKKFQAIREQNRRKLSSLSSASLCCPSPRSSSKRCRGEIGNNRWHAVSLESRGVQMNTILMLAALGEAGAGVLLLAYPLIVVRPTI